MEVDVDVVAVLVDEVDVDVDVLVVVDVVLVVVSHPLHVLSHCFATNTSEHNPTAKRLSHFDSEKTLTLFAHL